MDVVNNTLKSYDRYTQAYTQTHTFALVVSLMFFIFMEPIKYMPILQPISSDCRSISILKFNKIFEILLPLLL